MKRKILAALLTLVMVFSLLPVSAWAEETTYSDVAGHWAQSAILRWSDYGVLQGSEGKFSPDGTLTRGQMAVEAIAGYIRKTHPTFRIVYIKSEDFMNDLLDALQTGFAAFHQKYRQADLLLMDDVQFLSNKVQMQEQFFHTFETLFQAGKQIVLTSDRPPKEIATLNERLRTRFESGLLADIQSPDLETRMAMIKAKAAATGIQLPQKVVAYIAENITNNVRELEGAVKKIAAIHTLMDRPIDMELAQEAIRDIFKEKPGLHPTPEMILKEVAEYFAIEQSRLVSKARSKDIVVPRQVACYLMRDIGGMSYPEIGKVFGQHHTSIIYGVEKLTSAMAQDEQLKNKVSDLQKNITEQ